MIIRLKESIVRQIIQSAEAAYPCECCGLIIGDQSDNAVNGSDYLPLANQHRENRQRRFLIDPQAYLDAEDSADKQGLAIIGIVHSHPDHPDEPSEFDRLHAWPNISYVIVSVNGGKAQRYRSWRLTEDRTRFDREEIQIRG